MKHLLIIVVILIMLFGCTTKPEVIVIGENTYYFEKGVENFYVVDIETGEKIKVK